MYNKYKFYQSTYSIRRNKSARAYYILCFVNKFNCEEAYSQVANLENIF